MISDIMLMVDPTRKSGGEDRVRIQQTLKLSPLFERVSRTTRDAAIDAAQVEVVPGGTLVIEQGSTPQSLLVLGRRGRARIERTAADGRVVPLGYRGRGDVLGESCLGRAKKHGESANTMESMLFRNVEARLCEVLIKAADRWGVPTPKGTLISAPITHLEIAQAIGSTRETVTLTLGTLRRAGLLDVAGRRLIVTDRETLAARQ